MTRWFQRLPIRQKLMAMILAASSAVVILASAAQLVTGYFSAREDAVSDLLAQARIVLDNAAPPLMFQDQPLATETLHTLQANPGVRTACLYGEDQRLYAEFRREGAVACPDTAPSDQLALTTNRIIVGISQFAEGKRTASLYARSDLGAVQRRLQQQLVIVLIVMLVTLGVAILLSAWLQVLVSAPIAELSRAASAVSSRGDYSVRAVRRTDDELGLLVDAFNDMLQRIQTREAELSHANEELRREIAERRRAEQERAELLVREREANRLKDEFLATLSHELRTPLNAILGWTKLLRGNAVAPDGVDRALEKVERNAQVQARLVEDLLEVSRITTGKLRLDIRELDLIALANTAIDSIRPAAEARGVVIERAFDAPSLLTAGDPDRLQQVIWNLVSNAVKFTPAGGLVRVAIQRHDTVDELVVSDTGIGIDPAFLPSVFETFRQADASSTRAHGGLGLGLAIVRHLVEAHGGTVSAASGGTGRGATFTVRLPVRVSHERQLRQTSDDIPAASPVLSGVRLLVVDDDADTRELLQSALEQVGARVYAAGSAQDALAQFRRERPEAVVSDIGMPGQDGYQLLTELQRSPGGGPRVAIALSAYAAPRDRERSLQAGFQRHMVKPVDPAAVVETLRELLDETAAGSARG
ncbi:MAG TPA: ATP-binding protein [Vicinamibacterales bacterium]|nr:ATP-binding protein [Vicinamibacterales bacterium]